MKRPKGETMSDMIDIPPGIKGTAIFAGGCFWGLEDAFARVPGVIAVESGYIGGTVENPSYEEVCTGTTGHAEAVRVIFNKLLVSYEELARFFFEIHDPTQENRQGPDIGPQYRSAVFYLTDAQKNVVDELIARLQMSGYEIVTEVNPAGEFYPAEEYHQEFLRKHPERSTCHCRVSRFSMPA